MATCTYVSQTGTYGNDIWIQEENQHCSIGGGTLNFYVTKIAFQINALACSKPNGITFNLVMAPNGTYSISAYYAITANKNGDSYYVKTCDAVDNTKDKEQIINGHTDITLDRNQTYTTVKIQITNDAYQTLVANKMYYLYLWPRGPGNGVVTLQPQINGIQHTISIDDAHNYSKIVVTNPTCALDGYTTHTCEKCNTSYKDSYTSATNKHTYSNYQTTIIPTATTAGKLTGTCSGCSMQNTVTLPEFNNTDYASEIIQTATCVSPGKTRYRWKTTTYGTFSYEVTTSSYGGHDYTINTTEPTYASDGKHTYTCQRSGCRHSYIDIIPKKECGMVHIHNGMQFNDYYAYIYNGNDWDLYIPYIKKDSDWNMCC